MVRLLGTVQRRNYHLLGVTAVLTPDSKAFDVVLDFKPIPAEDSPWYRSPEVLERMVLKLIDVEKVELEKPAASDTSSAVPPDNGSGETTPKAVAKKGGDKS